ncbi:MAG: hypothetical protein WBV61_13000 [Rhodanobacteraceae bacterium]
MWALVEAKKRRARAAPPWPHSGPHAGGPDAMESGQADEFHSNEAPADAAPGYLNSHERINRP